MAGTELGKTIRLAREREGLTQRNLADAIDREQGYVSKIENGHTPAPDWVLTRWAPLLRVSYNALILARAGIPVETVEGDDDEVEVRFAGRVPADSVRWCEVEGKAETVHVWGSMLQAHDPDKCFVVKASGDCLLREGIKDGKMVLLREPEPNEQPRNGAIVLVRIGDEFSLKLWQRSGRMIRLVDGDENAVFETDVDHAGVITVLGIYLNDYRDPNEGVR